MCKEANPFNQALEINLNCTLTLLKKIYIYWFGYYTISYFFNT